MPKQTPTDYTQPHQALPPLPNLRHLTAALEVNRVGSINRAAERVHLSQSAITQGLAKLERALAVELFTRSPTGVFTTEAGQCFLARIERAIASLAKIDGLFAEGSSGKNRQLHRLLTSTQLRALISVVEHGSYTLAANQLGLAQPTVHRAVRELESLCRQTFFSRSPAGVEPLWPARQVARLASLFFAEYHQAIEALAELAGSHSGSLRVGSLPLARTRLVPHAVTQLLAEYPNAQVSIIDGPYEEQLHSLLHGQSDVIVGALRYPPPSPHIQQELLFSDPLHIVVRPGHVLAKRAPTSAAELQGLSWIAPKINTPARGVFSRFFLDQGFTPPARVIECSSLVAIRGLLLESDRVALLSAQQVEVEVQAGLLAVCPQALPGSRREIGLTLRRDWLPTNLQQRFLALLRAGNQA
ncbi:LysR family transcriptional regulator [Halioxenophilus sp. WMMB6]|uniref:LysR family transcriptional regulator n=1 Tax=Halioxenophilus sp. WMMB6 TaxID=3073815 RepID=UPI00295E3D48|nr:LysR family transcriptional regulator [Halioxenophilus sp. WMMB6]